MRTRLSQFVLFALSAMTPAAAQPACNEPFENSWLTPPEDRGDGVKLDPALVLPVTQQLSDSIDLLATQSSAPLTHADVVRFIGKEPDAAPGNTRPYLVRTVFPVPAPQIEVFWHGDDLQIVARGLGCAPFLKHPIIVYLDRQPAGVAVAASAAM